MPSRKKIPPKLRGLQPPKRQRVYVVFGRNGGLHSVHATKEGACKAVRDIGKFYTFRIQEAEVEI